MEGDLWVAIIVLFLPNQFIALAFLILFKNSL